MRINYQLFRCITFLIVQPCFAAEITDFGIFSASDVTLTSYSTTIGDVYAGGNLRVDFGFGIQRPTANAGSMYSRGNYSQGLLSEVKGNVFANGSVTLEGNAKVVGNVTRGGALSLGSGSQISGTSSFQNDSVSPIALPPSTNFVPGVNNVTATDSILLTPGSYRDFSLTQSFRTLTLTSGDYFLKSLTLATGTQLNLQLSSIPLRVFIQQDADFGTGLSVAVNGINVGENNPSLPVSLASNVLFESHSDVLIQSGFLNEFFGTIFTPFGGVTMNLQDMHGSIVSALPITGNVYMDSRPSVLFQAVPEPNAAILVSIGLGTILGRRRNRM